MTSKNCNLTTFFNVETGKFKTIFFNQVGDLHHSPAMSNMNASDEVDCLEFVVPPPISQPELGQGDLLDEVVCKWQSKTFKAQNMFDLN